MTAPIPPPSSVRGREPDLPPATGGGSGSASTNAGSACWPTGRLKVAALHWLRARYPAALLLCEFGLGGYGEGGQMDVVALTGEELIGVEVKGDGDSPARLPLQGVRYAQVSTDVWLLPSPSIARRCRRQRPNGWGLLQIDDHGQVQIGCHPCTSKRVRSLNSAAALWSTLWVPEQKAVHRLIAQVDGRAATVPKEQVPEVVPLGLIREHVLRALRERDWWRGGNYPKREIWRPSEALPPPEDREAA